MGKQVTTAGNDLARNRTGRSVARTTELRCDDPTRERVAICLCQGAYWKGQFHSDFPVDDGHHEAHLLALPDQIRRWRTKKIVWSGGYTKRVPVSESESTSALYRDAGIDFQTEGCALAYDSVALDTPENVICGLMATRVAWPTMEIGTIVLLSCHRGKAARVALIAAALGISTLVRFEGFVGPEHLGNPEAATVGEKMVVSQMRDDPLAFAPSWENKRRGRYTRQGVPYESRWDELAARFPATCCHIARLRGVPRAMDELHELRSAFAREVIELTVART
jgi:hypothetical protein